MASDRCYYYYEDDDDADADGDGEEEVEWLAMEADEDDVGLLEEDDLHLRLPDDRPADCWAITQESLPAAQQQDLSMVMNLLNIKQHHARTLLIHHRWKMHCIYDHLDRKGRDRMLSEACIILPKNSMSAASSTSVTCNVCFEDFSMTDVSTMDCGHCFCNDCWTEHFFASINTGNRQIRCMEVKCKAICDEDIVRRLLSLKYPAASKRFDLLLLESYLEDNDSVKWCPSAPHCGRAIQVHSPCPCAIWEKWKAKGHGDSDSVKWILANTKSCPKCSKPIEKNGGCNLVHCKCGQCLCISGHSCNRYKEENGDKVDTSRQQMQRYTHYWDRYNIHAGSYKVEQKDLGPAVEEQVKKLESNLTGPKMNWDGSWLAMAYQSLLTSRQVLSRSYAFAYYMFGGGEVKTHPSECSNLAVAQNLFEDRQEQLERHVEHLSKELATDLLGMPEEIVLKKVEIANLAKIVQAICGQLYRCIQDELLPLLFQPMNIAAYQPDGPDKAKEFIRA
uniref:RBR-type E3 ubiquitin transferase n=1 Tax=Oryza glumipatula TaxID=40148 RepID=A0A0D9ZAR2_9ORYZ